jgi:hypothetical protein
VSADAPRTPDAVARDIERERDQLAAAVSNLRSDFRTATDPRTMLRERWPLLAGLAAVMAGVIAVIVLAKRHSPDEVELARIGRLVIVQRD